MLYLGRFLYLDILAGTNRKSYAWGLAGYTALIIVITIQPNHCLRRSLPSNVVARSLSVCVCDYGGFALFSAIDQTRSGRELESLLVAQYQLMQLCIKQAMVKLSIKPGAIWCDAPRRSRYAQQPEYGIFPLGAGQSTLKAINTLSLTLITQSCETYLFRIRARN